MAVSEKCAVIFPGQGSQFAGMGHDLYQSYPPVGILFDKASEALGFDLAAYCFKGSDEELNETRITQPAIFVHSVATYYLLQEKGFSPLVAAGHSLGEYSALVAAGYLSFEEGISLVGLRGALMQKAGDNAPGAMAAIIGLEDDRVAELCKLAQETVVPANFNAPGQVVISGSLAGVESLMEAAGRAGAKIVKKLRVSGAFHSPLMSYAYEEMQVRLREAKITRGRIPVVANVSAEFETEPEKIRSLLARQITSPVLWTASIERMISSGIEKFVEVGPGNVLAGLCRRINRSVKAVSVSNIEQLNDFVS
ncbi:MAG TPA: ACP S-malonyltransferase [archaeon]|nr:ACP S-malonyltransferase [archaeon]